LELFFPIFILADICGEEILEEILKLAKVIVKDRKDKDREENTDVQLYEFISQYSLTGYVEVSTLVQDFQKFIDSDDKWINSRWLGKNLRKLKLVIDSRYINIKFNLLIARNFIKIVQ